MSYLDNRNSILMHITERDRLCICWCVCMCVEYRYILFLLKQGIFLPIVTSICKTIRDSAIRITIHRCIAQIFQISRRVSLSPFYVNK